MIFLINLIFFQIYACDFSYTKNANYLTIKCQEVTKEVKVNDLGHPIIKTELSKAQFKKFHNWKDKNKDQIYKSKSDTFNCLP